jgi:Intracellular proteinase inhibitor
MNTRLTISLLGAGVLAFACGPRSRSESAAVASVQPLQLTNKIDVPSNKVDVPTNKVDVPSKRRASTKVEGKIDSHFNVNVASNEIRFALNVTNVGKKHVELRFPNGKSYDFVVLDSLGREVWHWSNGRMFTQGMQNKQLGTGDVMRVSEAWKRPLQPGKYTAIATLNSSNYPIEERADFTLP